MISIYLKHIHTRHGYLLPDFGGQTCSDTVQTSPSAVVTKHVSRDLPSSMFYPQQKIKIDQELLVDLVSLSRTS